MLRNWLLGRRIAEEELKGETREELYGRKVIPNLSEELTREYGKGFTKRSLYQCVQFYQDVPGDCAIADCTIFSAPELDALCRATSSE